MLNFDFPHRAFCVRLIMATPESLTEILAKSQQALADTLAGALQGLQIKRAPSVRLSKFCGRPVSSGEQTLSEWINDLETYLRQMGIPEQEKVDVALDHLGGSAKEEIKCCPVEDRNTLPKLVALLKLRFGAAENLRSLNNTFYRRTQLEGETLTEFSRSLMQIYDRMEAAAGEGEKDALRQLRSNSLRGQFIEGIREPMIKREAKRLSHDNANLPFYKFREVVLGYFEDADPVPSFPAAGCLESNIGAIAKSKPNPERELLLSLVEGQKSLAAAIAETNEHLKSLSESLKSKATAPKSSKVLTQCTFCGRTGHTFERCFRRRNQEKNANTNPDSGGVPDPKSHSSSGNAIPPS